MSRTKRTEREQMRLLPPESADAPEGDAVLEALRANLNLLGELANRYQVAFRPERPDDMPVISCPQDVHNLAAPEMERLAQEQLRVLLLDTRNRVTAQHTIYQGNVNSSVVRPAEALRPAVIDSAPSIISVGYGLPYCSQPPQRRPGAQPPGREHHQRHRRGGRLLGIELLDHVVIGDAGSWVSLKERGLMDRKTG